MWQLFDGCLPVGSLECWDQPLMILVNVDHWQQQGWGCWVNVIVIYTATRARRSLLNSDTIEYSLTIYSKLYTFIHVYHTSRYKFPIQTKDYLLMVATAQPAEYSPRPNSCNNYVINTGQHSSVIINIEIRYWLGHSQFIYYGCPSKCSIYCLLYKITMCMCMADWHEIQHSTVTTFCDTHI